jgi:hypothetical protein
MSKMKELKQEEESKNYTPVEIVGVGCKFVGRWGGIGGHSHLSVQ